MPKERLLLKVLLSVNGSKLRKLSNIHTFTCTEHLHIDVVWTVEFHFSTLTDRTVPKGKIVFLKIFLPWPKWLNWGSTPGERGSAKSSLPPSEEGEKKEKDREWARRSWHWGGESCSRSSTSCPPISQVWDLRTPSKLLTHRPSTPFLLWPERPLMVAKGFRATRLHFLCLPMFRLWASISRARPRR